MIKMSEMSEMSKMSTFKNVINVNFNNYAHKLLKIFCHIITIFYKFMRE